MAKLNCLALLALAIGVSGCVIHEDSHHGHYKHKVFQGKPRVEEHHHRTAPNYYGGPAPVQPGKAKFPHK